MKNTISVNCNKNKETDILIVGGGLAGVSAALAAGRKGKKVLLIESGGCLGGLATKGHVSPLDATETCLTRLSFAGICGELVNEIKKANQIYGSADGNLIVNPTIVQLILTKKITEVPTIEVLFHTTLFKVNTKDKQINEVYCVNKSGVIRIEAKAFVDASGDGDLFYLAGDEYFYGTEEDSLQELQSKGLDHMHFEEGNEEGNIKEYKDAKAVQPVSCMFTMGNVDIGKGKALCNRLLKYEDLNITKEEFQKLPYAGTPGFEENGDLIPLPQGRLLFYTGTRKNEAIVNMSRVIHVNTVDAEETSKAQMIAQMQVFYLADFLKKYVPGFENSYLVGCATTLGIRESRRLIGMETLSGTRAFDCICTDQDIAYGSYMIDIHDPSGKRKAIGGYLSGDCYGIPYGTIASRNFENLLVAGRCISADHVAHASTRIQGTCIQTGQAAGTAASMLIDEKCSVQNLSVSTLRETLKKDGMFIQI